MNISINGDVDVEIYAEYPRMRMLIFLTTLVYIEKQDLRIIITLNCVSQRELNFLCTLAMLMISVTTIKM